MASSHLESSICPIYPDPVTLKCGHNSCRDCIGRVLDTQGENGGYSCPECREEFQERPVLQKNITLCPISETLQTTQGDRDKTGISCTYCIHTPVPAVISCLLFEAPLCDDHLRVHSKSPEHVLCDPTTSPENRKCPVHKKILAYYCTEDSTCICVSCRLDGEHRGHQVETLDEASEKKKKRLRNVLQKLELKKEELSRKMRHIEELCNMTDPLTVLQESGTGDLCGTEDGDHEESDTGDLCGTEDGDHEESGTGDLCDTEDGDHEDRERRDNLLHDGGDLDVAGISRTLHTGLSNIMSGANVEKCTGTHVYPHSTTEGKGHTNARPSRTPPQPTPTIQPSRPHTQHTPTIQLSGRCPQPTPTIQCSHRQAGEPNIMALQQTSGIADIFLDVRTAGNHLHISDDGKTVSYLPHHKCPETPERFRCPQVMSSQSFSSGRHYWEVDVGGSRYWTVGVCYPSTDRSGDLTEIGYNKKSWGLERWDGNPYYVIHDGKEIQLFRGVSSKRVRIDLDYEAGRISFYDLCDPIRHLHTFTTTFTEPLHAEVWVGDGHIKICGGNTM